MARRKQRNYQPQEKPETKEQEVEQVKDPIVEAVTDEEQLEEIAQTEESKAKEQEDKVPDYIANTVVDNEVDEEEVEEVIEKEVEEELQDIPDPREYGKPKSKSQIVDLDALNDELSGEARAPLSVIINYIDQMKPNADKTLKEIVSYQSQFCNALYSIVNRIGDTDFYILWPAILDLFEEYKDSTLKEELVFRRAESWEMTPMKRDFYRLVVNLIFVTRKRSTRALAVKQIQNWSNIFATLTPTGVNRLQDFYRL